MTTVHCIDESPKTVPLCVLVVDDFEPFRHFVCSTLQKQTGLVVVGEAADGLEAVQMAEKLRPNIVVLDIGLPTLDGIEAARRIRAVSPLSRILFVSQESSTDIVQEALSLASGYVIKTHAGIELLAAVEALRLGDRFIGDGLSGFGLTSSANSQRPNQL
jgi:DNA-binding NarL/FixJ family response regulator